MRPPHSLHAYFLLGGDPKVPIIYDSVDRIRDGKSFTTRRVVAIRKHGRAIFSTEVSRFTSPKTAGCTSCKMPGSAEARRRLAPATSRSPRPAMLPMMPEPVRRYYERERPIELRPVEYGRYLGQKLDGDRFHVWIRATGRLPDEPAIHQCVLAYASDMTLLDTALVPLRQDRFQRRRSSWPRRNLDHALWFPPAVPQPMQDGSSYAQDSLESRRCARSCTRARSSRAMADWSLRSLRKVCCDSAEATSDLILGGNADMVCRPL